MTNKEAIEVLRFNADFCDAELEDAINLAISALEKQESAPDPWDGVKPHAPDGFVAKYCEPYTEEK